MLRLGTKVGMDALRRAPYHLPGRVLEPGAFLTVFHWQAPVGPGRHLVPVRIQQLWANC